MKCEKFKMELPGLLWGEINQEEREELLKHLAQCEDCRNEWKELKNTETVMLELGDENPSSEPVFIQPKSESVVVKIWDWISAGSALKWGLAAAVIIALLWIAKPSVYYKDGDFQLSFGAPPTPAAIDLTAVEQKLKADRLETLKLVSQIIKEQNEEQRRDFNLKLATFASELEKQRRLDLAWMQTGLTGVQKSSRENYIKTNMFIEGLIRNAAYQKNDSLRR